MNLRRRMQLLTRTVALLESKIHEAQRRKQPVAPIRRRLEHAQRLLLELEMRVG